MKKIFKGIGLVLLGLVVICFFFSVILWIGIKFIESYGHEKSIISDLNISDIIIYIVYIIQLVVTAILSIMVYRLSKSSEDRDIKAEKLYKKNAIKYIKNEINYNKSIISVLKTKNIEMNKVNKYLFKTEAWDKYSIVLIELLKSEDYNEILSYYSIIQLYNIKEIQDEVIEMIKNTDDVMEILKNSINKLN